MYSNAPKNIQMEYDYTSPVQVAERSKAWVCGFKSSRGMDVCLL